MLRKYYKFGVILSQQSGFGQFRPGINRIWQSGYFVEITWLGDQEFGWNAPPFGFGVRPVLKLYRVEYTFVVEVPVFYSAVMDEKGFSGSNQPAEIKNGQGDALATISQEFIKIFFQKNYDEIRTLAEGGAQPNLNVGKIKNSIIALPPLAEQKRIVEKTHRLIKMSNKLRAGLVSTKEVRNRLVEALLWGG